MPRLSSIGSRALAGLGLLRIPTIPEIFYYPLTNTAFDPTTNTWRDFYAPPGYIFVPNDGIYTESPITSMQLMFDSSTINDPDIVLWDVSTVTDMNNAFALAYDFNQPIGSWDVSNVTNMNQMFLGAASFNQPLAFWDVSSVTSMDLMFRSAASFNQDLSNWCVSNFSFGPFMFVLDSGYNFDNPNWELNMPVWGTCPPIAITGYAELNDPGFNQTIFLVSEAGSADSMLEALNALSINDTFEWTSPYNPNPTQRYTATLLSGNVGVGSSWRFQVSVVLPTPSGQSTYSNYAVDKIFVPRS